MDSGAALASVAFPVVPAFPFLAVGVRALRSFDLFPVFQHRGRILGFCVAENVRVASDHLRVDGFDDVGNGESAGLFGQNRVERDLQQQIAQFRREFVRVRDSIASRTS